MGTMEQVRGLASAKAARFDAARKTLLGGNAPSLADPEDFRAALDALGLTVNSAGAKLGLLPRQARRYASRSPTDHRDPPRCLEILICLLIALA